MIKNAHDKDFQQAVKVRRNKGLSWDEIAEKLKSNVNAVLFAYELAILKPADKITAPSDAALAKKIVAARNKDKLSWVRIAARTGLTTTQVRGYFTEATGKPSVGQRIGKGGRNLNDAPSKASPARKAAIKKVAAKRSAKRPAKRVASKVAAPNVVAKRPAKRVAAVKTTTAPRVAKRPAKKVAPTKVATKAAVVKRPARKATAKKAPASKEAVS